MATPGTSIRLKRLRQRFGIRAPKLAIKTHVAWYWRALATVLITSLSLVLAAWLFDLGKNSAFFSSGAPSKETQALRLRITELEAELSKVRSIADSSESSLSIEHATQQQLARQVGALESENAGLKQDLAFFESMGSAPAAAAGDETGVSISRLRVEPESRNGQYRYRMLLVHKGGRQAKEFKGALQLLVKVQQAGENAMITIPSESEQNLQRYRFEVRYFQRTEGVFSVPSGAVVKSVEARLLQDGIVRARQSVTL